MFASVFMLSLFGYVQTGRKRVRRLHALRYAGRSPCRCFAPVLIRKNGELLQCSLTSISRKPIRWLADQQILKVAPFPPVLQLLLRPESFQDAPLTKLIP